MNDNTYDLIIGGAGIVGLSHALSAVKRGLKVAIIERTPKPTGASVRNFGFFWLIGQESGDTLDLAYRSREIWLDMILEAKVWARKRGSIFLAGSEIEEDVLEEFNTMSSVRGYQTSMLTKEELKNFIPSIASDKVRKGLLSTTEIQVSPFQAIFQLIEYLKFKGVDIFFSEPILHVESGRVVTSARTFKGSKIVLGTGSDIYSLFPHFIEEQNTSLCTLQMMKLKVEDKQRLPKLPIATGSAILNTPSFQQCESFRKLDHKINVENPQFREWGINLMIGTTPSKDIILGNSHEYGGEKYINKNDINEYLLEELRKILGLGNFKLQETWNGTYLKTNDKPYFHIEAERDVHLVNGLGGNGMTLSFGIAEKHLHEWLGMSVV